ncbi:MAG: hypothetical protein LQ342_006474 [Letrouitia transgressa]|nr:MAG: hypothetical protein LQ342_006474 [Letrouitia transgressa]
MRPFTSTFSRPLSLPFLLPRLQLPRPSLLLPLTSSRPATHASEGRANAVKSKRPGKRLGAKKASRELVVPGNIIFRQRGTHWYPGENCGMGRDHTIFAKAKGYVIYYKDPEQISVARGSGQGQVPSGVNGRGEVEGVRGKRKIREGRKYIGVVFEREDSLPRRKGQARKRKVGLVARRMSTSASSGGGDGEEKIGDKIAGGVEEDTIRETPKEKRAEVPYLRSKDGRMYRETNHQIGKYMERTQGKVTGFMKWNKRNARKYIDMKPAEKRKRAREKRIVMRGLLVGTRRKK